MVVKACFGNTVDPIYNNSTDSFKNRYYNLKIKVTLKVHGVLFHIEGFLEMGRTSLWFLSEQAMQSVHFDFNINIIPTIRKMYHAQFASTKVFMFNMFLTQ